MAEWIEAKVIENRSWTDDLFSIIVQAPIAPFTAGQFAKLALDIEGERVQRAYSYVNSPNNPRLEFYLVNVSAGKLSPKLHALRANDRLMITKHAAGFFVLEEIPNCTTLWMLATGTAIGPYLSFLQAEENLARFENLVLVHAVRYQNDLSYLPMMQQLQDRYAGKLRIHTVVSREQCAQSMHGRLPALIESGTLERTVGLPLEAQTSHVMLCGNPQMVRDTQQLLQQTRGMNRHFRRKPGQVTSENYW